MALQTNQIHSRKCSQHQLSHKASEVKAWALVVEVVVEVDEEEVAEEVEEGVEEVNPENASTHRSQVAASKRDAPSFILQVRTIPNPDQEVFSRMADQDQEGPDNLTEVQDHQWAANLPASSARHASSSLLELVSSLTLNLKIQMA